MMFMNEGDIDHAAQLFQWDAVMGPATRFLQAFMQEVNSHSDGWPYWSPPVHACKQLITLIQREQKRQHGDRSEPVTLAEVQKALSPIKSFMTRRGRAAGMSMPVLE